MGVDVEAVLQEYAGLIYTMASIALSRVRKPTIYTIEDLEQEGRAKIIERFQRWWNPDTDTPALRKTFIFGALQAKFSDIVYKSYKVPEETPENQRLPLRTGTLEDPVVVCCFEETIFEGLSSIELEYVVKVLMSRAKISQTREIVREELGISYNEELLIRKSIQEKLGSF